MGLTLPQATLAGQIAAQITALNTALSAAQAALKEGRIVSSHGLTVTDLNSGKASAVNSSYQLSSADSISILSTLINAYQSSIITLNNQLAGM